MRRASERAGGEPVLPVCCRNTAFLRMLSVRRMPVPHAVKAAVKRQKQHRIVDMDSTSASPVYRRWPPWSAPRTKAGPAGRIGRSAAFDRRHRCRPMRGRRGVAPSPRRIPLPVGPAGVGARGVALKNLQLRNRLPRIDQASAVAMHARHARCENSRGCQHISGIGRSRWSSRLSCLVRQRSPVSRRCEDGRRRPLL